MKKNIAIIGGGPAGLMAAEVLATAGHAVTVYERKPSLGRKFLMAGRGGLNLTHSEEMDFFIRRYGAAATWLRPMIEQFTPQNLRDWCEGLGETTFIGSSGRVFPKAMKASPLLRAWQYRLATLGVTIKLQKEWQGWDSDGNLAFGTEKIKPDATFLALGGASWPKLGSDGSWAEILKKKNIEISPLRPANCGFAVDWTDIFRDRFAGQPLKPLAVTVKDKAVQGEAMISAHGIEGGAIYALSADIRHEIETNGEATLQLDLRPGLPAAQIEQKLSAPRAALSFSNYLRRTLDLDPLAISLLREADKEAQKLSSAALAKLIKAIPIKTTAPFSIDRAISTAGGVALSEVDDGLMLKKMPGIFVAGEMLDWEAPTGGYLLQACFSTAVHAAKSLKTWLESQKT